MNALSLVPMQSFYNENRISALESYSKASKSTQIHAKSPKKNSHKTYRYARKKTSPNNARLNLLLSKKSPEKFQKTLSDLLESLYKNSSIEPQIHAYKEILSQEIINATLNQTLQSETDYATLDIADEEIQYLLYQILKGSQGDYPSLLEYITYVPGNQTSNTSKVNIHYCSYELLKALLSSEEGAKELINARREYIESQENEKKRLLPILEKYSSDEELSFLQGIFDYTKGKY